MLIDLAKRFFHLFFEICLWIFWVGSAISGCIFGAMWGGLLFMNDNATLGAILGGIVGVVGGVVIGAILIILYAGLIAIFLELAENVKFIMEMTGNIRSHEVGEKSRLLHEVAESLRNNRMLKGGAPAKDQNGNAYNRRQNDFLLMDLIDRLVSTGKGQEDPFAPNTTDAQTGYKKCPYCAEMIRTDAVICRFCRHDVGGV